MEERRGVVGHQHNYHWPAPRVAVRKSLKYISRIALVAVPAAAQV